MPGEWERTGRGRAACFVRAGQLRGSRRAADGGGRAGLEAAGGYAPAWPSWPVLKPAAGLDRTEVALRAEPATPCPAPAAIGDAGSGRWWLRCTWWGCWWPCRSASGSCRNWRCVKAGAARAGALCFPPTPHLLLRALPEGESALPPASARGETAACLPCCLCNGWSSGTLKGKGTAFLSAAPPTPNSVFPEVRNTGVTELSRTGVF